VENAIRKAIGNTMTERQEKYKANRIAGMLPENAAVAAGYSVKYARKKAYLIERVAEVGIKDALERAGLTAKYQADKLYKLTNATKVISCNIFVDKDGQMKKADGKSMDFIEIEDPSIQLRALEHTAVLKKQTSTAAIVDLSKHEHYTIYRPEAYTKESLVSTSRPAGRSI
jgi:hypothetical protein